MLSSQFFFSFLGLLASSVSAFTIISPSASSYWVQFSSNTISWSKAANDPSQVSLQIINNNQTLLNGAFSIAEYVAASLESYTITNVTLVVADGYIVQMVNPSNSTQVLATSAPFSVKPNGTAPAPGTGPGGVPTDNMSGMPGMSGMNGSATTNGRNGTNTSNFNNHGNNNTAGTNAQGSASSFYTSPIYTFLPLVTITFGLVMF